MHCTALEYTSHTPGCDFNQGNVQVVMGTIILDHKIGGMLDHDLMEENL